MLIASAIACILSGLITVLLTYYKPPAYWNNASRSFFRPLIGDRVAAPLEHRATAWLHDAIAPAMRSIIGAERNCRGIC
ncbi:MAG: hypothetical protein HC899_30700 [Leptolyngbyaceae cyanobacterium SM1_4_3]|nr:hypothetical protein [Leptolyngbyaceae cyanobacterium SM1_4_3]